MLEFFNDYYTGNHPLPWLAPTARDEFRRLVQMTRSNYMGLVCDCDGRALSRSRGSASVTMRPLTGTRGGSGRRTTWTPTRIMAWLEALIGGMSYFHVAPNPQSTVRLRMCGSSTLRRRSWSTSRARTGVCVRRR